MKKSAWGEMEQKTRGDWLYVHEDNTEGGVAACAGRKFLYIHSNNVKLLCTDCNV